MQEAKAGGLTPAADTEEEPSDLALVKISLNLSHDLLQAVASVAERRKVTKTEVIRRAVSMEVFFEEVRESEQGHLEIFIRRQGLMQQIVFPWLQSLREEPRRGAH